MLILTCPNCGPRNVAEFRFGGETNPRPKDPSVATDAEWSDYLYMRQNKMGVETEWWYHRAGCGLWFLAERNTATNEVHKTYVWQPKSS
ncbi:MAG TPA: sarcosine oxidase subunit delta [Anaerolineales bacterium]|nr:sarcosine oxidase subunit delta [Anaerolineales bacterium]